MVFPLGAKNREIRQLSGTTSKMLNILTRFRCLLRKTSLSAVEKLRLASFLNSLSQLTSAA